MSDRARWLLGLACLAMIVSMMRFVPGVSVGSRVVDFAIGLAAALMLGVLLTWRSRRAD